MTKKQEIGKLGEDFACEFLIKKKYKILDRNLRKPWGEIDIIAKAPDKTLVFIEVKTITEGKINPEEQLTKSKLEKLKKTASLYAGCHPKLISDKKGWQIDLIAITIKNSENLINHYENITDF